MLTLFHRTPKNLLALANRKSNKLQETYTTRSVAHSSFEFNLKRFIEISKKIAKTSIENILLQINVSMITEDLFN